MRNYGVVAFVVRQGGLKKRSERGMRMSEWRIRRWRRSDCEEKTIIASERCFPSSSSFAGEAVPLRKTREGVLNYEG